MKNIKLTSFLFFGLLTLLCLFLLVRRGNNDDWLLRNGKETVGEIRVSGDQIYCTYTVRGASYSSQRAATVSYLQMEKNLKCCMISIILESRWCYSINQLYMIILVLLAL